MAAFVGGTGNQPLLDPGVSSLALVAPAYTGHLESSSAKAAVLTDDSYEQNDTLPTARNLGTLTAPVTISNLVMADGADWYRIATTKTATGSDTVAIAFQHAQGDLNLEVYNSLGQRVLASAGVTNGEQVSLSGRTAGTYYIRVFGRNGVTNPSYSLTVNPPRTLVDDSYEQNDTRSTARNLGTLTATSTISNLVMADTHDWYRFTMNGSGGSANNVAISSSSSQGDLDLELYDANGNRLAVSESETNSEQISLSGRAAGTYYVHVIGYNGATTPTYTLKIAPGAATAPAPTPAPTTGAFDIQLAFSGLSANIQSIFEQAAQKWESIIVGDLSNATYRGVAIDDLLIHAAGAAIDGVGNILGQAGPDAFRSGSFLPYHGVMEFDTADLSSMLADGSLLGVIEHEMGHVLGIGTLWDVKGLVVGAGTSNPRFTGAKASAEYLALSGVSGGVPVENTGGAGTRDAHWRESIFRNEIMTGWVNTGAMPVSRLTVASLADIGYTVNLAAADAFSLTGGTSVLASGATASVSAPLARLVEPRLSRSTVANSATRVSNAQSTSVALPTQITRQVEQTLLSLSQRLQASAVDELLSDWRSFSRELPAYDLFM